MRILITGAHSTGKTTLAKALADDLCIPYVTADVFRNRNDGLKFSEIPEHELDVLEERFIEKTRFKESSFVTDSWGETVRWYSKNTKLWNVDKFNDFDFVFFLFPEFPEVDDGFRPMNHKFRMEVSNGIFSYLRENRPDFQILTGTVEQRIRAALYRMGYSGDLFAKSICFEGLPSAGKTTAINDMMQHFTTFSRSHRANGTKRPDLRNSLNSGQIQEIVEGYIDRLKTTDTNRYVISDRGWMTVFSMKYALCVANGIAFDPSETMLQLGRMEKHDLNVFLSVQLHESIRRSRLLGKRSDKQDFQFQSNVLAGYQMIMNNPSILRLSGDAPRDQLSLNRQIERLVEFEWRLMTWNKDLNSEISKQVMLEKI